MGKLGCWLLPPQPMPSPLWLSLSEGGKLEGVGTYEALSSKATAETIVPAGTSVSRSEAPWIRAYKRLCNHAQGSSRTESLPPKHPDRTLGPVTGVAPVPH